MTRKFYVCGLCGFVNCHKLIWCPKCPGEMTQREVEVGDYHWDTHTVEDLIKILKDQGLHYVKGMTF